MHLKSSPGTSPTTASESLWFLLQAGVRFFRCASAHQMRARGVEGGGEGGGLTGARVRPLCATHAQRRAAGRLAASRTAGAGAGARRTPPTLTRTRVVKHMHCAQHLQHTVLAPPLRAKMRGREGERESGREGEGEEECAADLHLQRKACAPCA